MSTIDTRGNLDAAGDSRPVDAAVDARPVDAAVDARPVDAATDAFVGNRLAVVSGDAQTGYAGLGLGKLLVVSVLDPHSNPVAGVGVDFAITSGSGTLSLASATTAADGTAKTALTLGAGSGTTLVTATATGLTGSPVVFHETAITMFGAGSNIAVGGESLGAAVADINRDGKPDLVVAGLQGGVVLLNTTPAGGAPSFAISTPIVISSFVQAIVAADFNGDGIQDVALLDGNIPGHVSVFLNTTSAGSGTPSFAVGVDFNVGNGPRALATGDLNGDGTIDIIVANSGSQNLTAVYNATPNGSNTPSFTPVSFGSAPSVIG